MRIKYARKLSFFIMWLLYVQLPSRKNRYGLVWTITINPHELPIDDEARKKESIASTGVRLYQHKKTKRETNDAL